MSEKKNNDSAQGMDYLQSLPRRWVTLYIPICIFVFVLLFPFYWMVVTSFKPNEELLSRTGNPFWVIRPTLAHFEKLLFHTAYPEWLWNTVVVSVVSTAISLVASVLAAYAIERLRFQGLPGAAVDLVHPAGGHSFSAGPVRQPLGVDPVVPDVFDPVFHLAADELLSVDTV